MWPLYRFIRRDSELLKSNCSLLLSNLCFCPSIVCASRSFVILFWKTMHARSEHIIAGKLLHINERRAGKTLRPAIWTCCPSAALFSSTSVLVIYLFSLFIYLQPKKVPLGACYIYVFFFNTVQMSPVHFLVKEELALKSLVNESQVNHQVINHHFLSLMAPFRPLFHPAQWHHCSHSCQMNNKLIFLVHFVSLDLN